MTDRPPPIAWHLLAHAPGPDKPPVPEEHREPKRARPKFYSGKQKRLGVPHEREGNR